VRLAFTELSSPTGCNHRIRRTAITYAHARVTLEPVRILPEFRPLRRTQRTESTFRDGSRRRAAGLASPGFVPPSGFLTLLTVFSSARPAGLFHPARAHGVRSSEPCSRSRAATPLGARCPPDVRGGTLPRTRLGRTLASAPSTFVAVAGLACAPRIRGAATARLQGLVSLDRAVSRAPGIGRSRVTVALTSFVSPGASRPRLPRRLTARSSHALHGRPFRSSKPPSPKNLKSRRSTRRGPAAL